MCIYIYMCVCIYIHYAKNNGHMIQFRYPDYISNGLPDRVTCIRA